MKNILSAVEIRELLEDRFATVTGEPREVTCVEIDIEPEQSAHCDTNWSAGCNCERAYRYAWSQIYEPAQLEYPVIRFD